MTVAHRGLPAELVVRQGVRHRLERGTRLVAVRGQTAVGGTLPESLRRVGIHEYIVRDVVAHAPLAVPMVGCARRVTDRLRGVPISPVGPAVEGRLEVHRSGLDVKLWRDVEDQVEE